MRHSHLLLSLLALVNSTAALATASPPPPSDQLVDASSSTEPTVFEDLETTSETFVNRLEQFGAEGGWSRLHKRAPKPASYYSAVVAVGASYTDNAHKRAAIYKDSLRDYYPYNKFGGRYSNGPVAVEYISNSTTKPALKKGSSAVKLYDYAYGGSVIYNGLAGTSSNYPAAHDQIATYLKDVKSGAARLGSGRVLHYFNSGINPVGQIWYNTIGGGITVSSRTAAKKAISENTAALATAIRAINKNAAVYSKVKGADYIIVGIPPLEIVPTYSNQIPSHFTESERKAALALLKTLTTQYNSEVKAFAAKLKKEARNDGKVFYFDLASLWYDINKTPTKYGLDAKTLLTACYNSTTGGLCTDPVKYLYFDTLHPVTSIHKLIAQRINALVNKG